MNKSKTTSNRRKNSTARSQVKKDAVTRANAINDDALATFVEDCLDIGECPVIQLSPLESELLFLTNYQPNIRA